MYKQLAVETLKSGETLTVGVVQGPDTEWAGRLAPFLGHKNADYRSHISRALEGPLDGLQTRFYVGCLGDEIAGQIMVVGGRGAGILAHVFTAPEHRRKGVCAAVMRHQMEDCRRTGFPVLCLGTAYDSPPYWIYHSFGFRPVIPETGRMKWLAEPDAEAALFRPAAAHVRDLRWDDWGYFDLLGYQPVADGEELPRCPTLSLKAQGSMEGPFVGFQLRREREPQIQAKVLESETGATAGWALLAPDTRWFRDVWLLDLYTHPNFIDHLPELAASVEIPDGPVAAYTTLPEGPKARALEAAGFRPAGALPRWLVHEGRRDLRIWMKEAAA